jgi:hypothetical protein
MGDKFRRDNKVSVVIGVAGGLGFHNRSNTLCGRGSHGDGMKTPGKFIFP